MQKTKTAMLIASLFVYSSLAGAEIIYNTSEKKSPNAHLYDAPEFKRGYVKPQEQKSLSESEKTAAQEAQSTSNENSQSVQISNEKDDSAQQSVTTVKAMEESQSMGHSAQQEVLQGTVEVPGEAQKQQVSTEIALLDQVKASDQAQPQALEKLQTIKDRATQTENIEDRGDAFFELSQMVMADPDVQVDARLSYLLAKQASEFGNENAYYSMAIKHRNGLGVTDSFDQYLVNLEQAAIRHHEKAALEAGQVYRDGINVEKDAVKALRYFELASLHNNAKAFYELGKAHQTGLGTPVDLENAAIQYQKAADQSDLASILELAQIHEKALIKSHSAEQAAMLRLRAASFGHYPSQLITAQNHLNGNFLEKSEEKAIPYLEAGAKNNDLQSILALAKIYGQPTGPLQNYTASFQMYKKAWELGATEVELVLSNIHAHGLGKQRDEPQAYMYAQSAAQRGDVQAMNVLGVYYLTGLGTAKDSAAAYKWINQAANLGNVDAQYQLGLMYQSGLGIFQDKQAALSWFEKAAKQGHLSAMVNMGTIYAQGTAERAPNAVAATAAWSVAAKHGNTVAGENLKEIASVFENKITAKQVQLKEGVTANSKTILTLDKGQAVLLVHQQDGLAVVYMPEKQEFGFLPAESLI